MTWASWLLVVVMAAFVGAVEAYFYLARKLHHCTLAVIDALPNDGAWCYATDLVDARPDVIKPRYVYRSLVKLEDMGFVASRRDPVPPPLPGMLARRQYRWATGATLHATVRDVIAGRWRW